MGLFANDATKETVKAGPSDLLQSEGWSVSVVSVCVVEDVPGAYKEILYVFIRLGGFEAWD